MNRTAASTACKLIGIQDTLARIIEDKSNRAIRFGVVNVASMVFLPI